MEEERLSESHVPDRSRGAKKCVDPGNEHKEKPSGASTDRETEIAERLQTTTPEREGERAWRNKSKTIELREGVNEARRTKVVQPNRQDLGKANLEEAFKEVKRNRGAAGIDRVTIKAFESELEHHLEVLQQALKSKTYRPKPVKRVYIPKADGTQRPLGIPTVGDRVVQAAAKRILEPIFEAKFMDCSYGFRPGTKRTYGIKENPQRFG